MSDVFNEAFMFRESCTIKAENEALELVHGVMKKSLEELFYFSQMRPSKTPQQRDTNCPVFNEIAS